MSDYEREPAHIGQGRARSWTLFHANERVEDTGYARII